MFRSVGSGGDGLGVQLCARAVRYLEVELPGLSIFTRVSIITCSHYFFRFRCSLYVIKCLEDISGHFYMATKTTPND